MPRHGIKINERVASNGSKSFHIRYANGGTLTRETFPTHELALQRCAEIEYWRKLKKLPPAARAERITVSDFIAEEWWPAESGGWKPGTKPAYRSNLTNWVDPYIGHMKLGEVSIETLDRYRQKLLNDGCGVPTINKIFNILEGVWNYAIKREWGVTNPFAALDALPHTPHKPKEDLSLTDVFKIIQIMSPLDGLTVMLMALMGLRQQEIFLMTWADLIDRDDQVVRSIKVNKSISGGEVVPSAKSAAGERSLKVPEPVRAWIEEVYDLYKRPPREQTIFLTRNHQRMTHQVFNRNRLAPALRQLGLVEKDDKGNVLYHQEGKFKGKEMVAYTPHSLRDVAGDIRVKAQWDLRQIAITMGHASITTTEKHYLSRLREQDGEPAIPLEDQLLDAMEKVGEPLWKKMLREQPRERVTYEFQDVQRVALDA